MHIDYNGHWGGQQELVPPLFPIKDLQIVNARIVPSSKVMRLRILPITSLTMLRVLPVNNRKTLQPTIPSGVQLIKRW